ncbi:hypothetical protein CEXT_117181, partial [Caerostris extrusa]
YYPSITTTVKLSHLNGNRGIDNNRNLRRKSMNNFISSSQRKDFSYGIFIIMPSLGRKLARSENFAGSIGGARGLKPQSSQSGNRVPLFCPCISPGPV